MKAGYHDIGFYFSLKKIPRAKRQALLVIFDFYREIENIILKTTEPHVAAQKCLWWKQQINKMKSAEADHPLARKLQSIGELDYEKLNAIIEGWLQNIYLPIFSSFEDTVVFIIQTVGMRERLLLEIIAPSHNFSLERIYQLTIILSWTHYLQHLRQYVRRGLIYFPQNEMETYGLTKESFDACQTSPEMKVFFAFQVGKIQKFYQQVKVSSPEKNLQSSYARVSIALKQLEAIAASDYQVLEQWIDITPVKKWWLVFRS